jgi:hypothetical protein
MMSEKNKPDLIAYTVTKNGIREFFNQIGAAWTNSKGGCSVKLYALPVNGDILLLPPKEGTGEPSPK